MKNKKIPVKHIILWLFIFHPYNFAHAAHSTNDNLLEFSQVLSNNDVHFNFSSNAYKTSFKKWGIN
jgi:hypothetical protein